jgi:hypothetical protein
MSGWSSRRDEHGLVLPTRLMVASISMVALAGLGYVATQSGDDDTPDKAGPAAVSKHELGKDDITAPQVSIGPGGEISEDATPKPESTKAAPVVTRAKFYVVVFNNSNVKGLAGKTATRAQRVGWNVVGTDNWYGTIDASTVYYPAKLKAAASVLARDLGIARVKPSIAPMRNDRLTVILTGDYAG